MDYLPDQINQIHFSKPFLIIFQAEGKIFQDDGDVYPYKIAGSC